MKIKEYYKEWGAKILIIRTIHKLFSLIGIYWEKSYLLTQEIDIKKIEKYFSSNQDLINTYTPQKLTLDDFNLAYKPIFNEKKMQVIKERFNYQDLYTAYGIIYDNKLIYSSWIYKKELILSYNTRVPMKQDALLLDDFCHPLYRGKGIHTMMIFYRLKALHSAGEKNIAVLVRTYNIKALKAQIKAGFSISKKIIIIKCFNKIYTSSQTIKN